eukprot:6492118-Amphidinium_carterae.1
MPCSRKRTDRAADMQVGWGVGFAWSDVSKGYMSPESLESLGMRRRSEGPGHNYEQTRRYHVLHAKRAHPADRVATHGRRELQRLGGLSALCHAGSKSF